MKIEKKNTIQVFDLYISREGMLRPFLPQPFLYIYNPTQFQTWELLNHNDYLLYANEELHRGKEGLEALLTCTLSSFLFFVSKSFHQLKWLKPATFKQWASPFCLSVLLIVHLIIVPLKLSGHQTILLEQGLEVLLLWPWKNHSDTANLSRTWMHEYLNNSSGAACPLVSKLLWCLIVVFSVWHLSDTFAI